LGARADELSSHLIHGKMLQVGNFMHYISRFLAGFAIGFSRVWQISLVTLSIVPLIAIAGGLYAYVTIGLMARVRKSYVKAGEIAEEVDWTRSLPL
jgi:ATP-binding cassette, subfamily B (MDR/TAP), member 1